MTTEQSSSLKGEGHIAVEYFRELFLSSNPSELEALFENFPSRVTQDMNEALIKEFTDEEIKQAAFAVKGNMAPGEDGLKGIFYKHYWHIVGRSVIAEVRSFLNPAILPAGWKHTQLCLIPKVATAETMK